jgi:phosphoribosylaminoimidazolecarboxamide formyltransferase/IMP cyclohydrolase
MMRAMISVSDKTGVGMLGQGLADLGATVFSTGGTRRALEAAGVPVRPVSDLTGFPEILDGRVKTLHPAIHGGILARRDRPSHLAELAEHGLEPIDLVAVNLYPFAETVARPEVTLAEALEQIDIGGPTLLRAAAKNFTAVIPLCDPADYAMVLEALRGAGLDQAARRQLAAKAFHHTAAYDALVAAYLTTSEAGWPDELALGLRKVSDLRYGENPHQGAAFYALAQPGQGPTGLVGARQLQGKALSYNNILDASAAWTVIADFSPPAVAIIKHTNPCGLAQADDLLEAYRLALAGDPIAAFGGIVAVNTTVEEGLAQQIVEHFYEIVLAPAFTDEALACLSAKPNLRLLELPLLIEQTQMMWRSVPGGMLVQEGDRLGEAEVWEARVVTQRPPTAEEWEALDFAWRAVRHVKSNAIVLAQGQALRRGSGQALVGMGAGQPSRVAAVEIALKIAGERAAGSVLASDAFFPKPDGVEVAAAAGVTSIVQPGGSIGDEAVIAAADQAGMAMVFTGVRHFQH